MYNYIKTNGRWLEMDKISNASKATDKALEFLLDKYPLRGKLARPVRTVKEDDLWKVEFNVGIVRPLIAKVKVDAVTGEIAEYYIPPLPEPDEGDM